MTTMTINRQNVYYDPENTPLNFNDVVNGKSR